MSKFYVNPKVLSFLAVFLSFMVTGQSQSINNYVFSTSNTASLYRSYGSLIDDIDMNMGSSILIGGSSTQNPNPEITAAIPMPFDFFVNGNRMAGTAPVSNYFVSANGWVFLGTSGGSAVAFGTNFTGTGARLAPFLGSMGTSAIGRVRSKTFGVQPNRILVIDFYRMVMPYNYVTDDSSTFQVRLYESNSAIEYVYGRMENRSVSNQSYNTGIHFANGTSPSYYQHVNTATLTASSTTNSANSYGPGPIANLNGAVPGSQRSLLWTPDPPDDVNTITFTNVTSTGMTLNWTSPSNEKGIAIYRSTDGLDYTNVATVNSNTINTYTFTGLIANTTYYWRVYSYREGLSAPVDGVEATLPASKYYTVGSGNWNDPMIWNTLSVPGVQDSAEISAGNTVTINATGLSCGTLVVKGRLDYGNAGTYTFTANGNVIVEPTGVFTAGSGFGSGTAHVLNIGGTTATSDFPGSLVVDGVLDLQTSHNVQTIFNGIQNSTVTGSGPTCELPFISCNKGTDTTAVVEFLRTYTQDAVVPTQSLQRLTVLAGTLKISAPVVTYSFFNTSLTLINPLTTSSGKLWLNHPGIILGPVPGRAVTQAASIVRGRLVIDNGALITGTGSAAFTLNLNSSIRLSGGSLTHIGTMSVLNNATTGLYVEGGELVLDPRGEFLSASAAAAVLNVPALAGFGFSSGKITIVDPHALAGASISVLIDAGGSKSITGGDLVIGSDTSSTAGPAVAANSGFGLDIDIPLYNLVIRNQGNTINSRYCRMLSNITVNNILTLAPNSYLTTGNGIQGFSLVVKGNVVNNGLLSGVIPGSTGRGGSINFTGISAQAVSGSGTASYLTAFVSNPAGVSFSNTGSWTMEKITLENGNVNNIANAIRLGSTDYSGTVVIGGLNETTTAGSFAVLPTINTTFGRMSYVYGPASNALQTGSFNEMAAGAQILTELTVNDAQGLTANRNLSINEKLTLTEGKLSMANNTLTVGTSASAPGSLVRTSGFVVLGSTGVFTRWFPAGNPGYTYDNGFPISTGTYDRSVLLNVTGTLSSGFNLSVRHNNVIGYTDIAPPFNDGISIDRRTNLTWVLTSSSSPSFSGTFNVRVMGAGIGAITDPQQLRLVGASSVLAGTSVAGSGTTSQPEVNKNFSQIQLLGLLSGSQNIYIGTSSGVNPLSPTITAINTGNWNDVNTWEAGVIPTITNNAVIAPGVTVTIPSSYTATCNGLTVSAGATLTGAAGSLNNAGGLIVNGSVNNNGTNMSIVSVSGSGITVNSGGTFTLSAGTITLGPSGGSNRKFLLDGTLTVSGGTLNVNGTVTASAGSAFNQSGGDINIDANNGTAAGSALQGEHLLSFPGVSTINCSGGTITIVDPPYSAHAATSTYALRINSSTGSLTSFSGTHTLRLGDGVSTTTGNANGFILDTKRSAGRHPLQNVTVNGGSATGRWATAAITSGTGTHIKGNVLVNSGSEFRHTTIAATLAIGGNITNNGTLTMAAPLILGGEGYVITNAQTISGTGTFRNSATSPTGAFTNLNVNNGTGLTLGTTDSTFIVTGTLLLNDLKITTNTNTIVTTATGLNRGTSGLGYIVGNLGKLAPAGNNASYTFEIGTAANYLPVTATYPVIFTGGIIKVGTTSGAHPQRASSCLNAARSINRYWTVTASGMMFSGGDYTFSFLPADVPAGTNLAQAKAFMYEGGEWKGGVTGTSISSTFTVSNMPNYGDVVIGEITPLPVSVSISASSTSICASTNVTFTANVVNGGPAPTYQWKVNGTNVSTSATYASNTLADGDQVSLSVVSSSTCVNTPGATSNTITMIVNQPTLGGTVTGGSTVCSGDAPSTLAVSGHRGTVVKWQYAVSPFTTFTDTAITTLTYTPKAITAATRYRAVIKNGVCSETTSSSRDITVNPSSNAGTVSGNTSVCSGLSAGNLTVSGHTGTIVRWETANDAAFTVNYSSTSTTSTTFAAGSPSQTTYYRVVVKSGVCPEATGTAHIITVIPATAGGTVGSNQSICAGNTPSALNLTGHTGSVLRWESSANSSFTSPVTIPSSAGLTSLSPTPSVTTYYRAVVQSGTCAIVNSSPALITISTAPGGGTISGPAAVCSGTGTGNLQLTGHTGSIVQWQTQTALSAPAWTNTGSSGNPYNPGNLTQTTKYRVVLSNPGCTNGYSNEFTVSVDVPSVAGTLSGTSTICTGSPAGNITLAGNTGTVRDWLIRVSPATSYSPVTPQNTTTTLAAGSPASETRYKAIVKNGTCANDTTAEHVIRITPASVGGSVSPATAAICAGNNSGLLTVSGHTGSVVKWQYATAPSFTYTDTAITTTTFTSGPLAVTTRFRAVISSGGCAPVNASYAEVAVDAPSVAGTLSGTASVCSGTGAGNITLSGNTGTVRDWLIQVSPATTYSPVTPQNTSTTLAAGSPTSETRYKVVVRNGVCNADTTAAHVISITPASVGGSVTPVITTLCAGSNSGLLTLSGHTGSVVKWQIAEAPSYTFTDTAITTTTFTSKPLSVTTRFRAVVSSGGCANANANYAEVAVNAPASAGTLANLGASAVCQGSTGPSLQLSGNTGTIQRWERATAPFTSFATITGTTGATHATGTLNQTTDFRVVVSTPGCPEITSNVIRVQVDSASLAGSASTTTTSVCSGGTPALLGLSGTVRGNVTRWESSSVAPYNVFNPIGSSASATYQPGALTTTTHFRAVVANGTCGPVTSAPVAISVTPGSVGGTVTGSTPVCSGSSTTLSLSGNTGTVLAWESATSPFTAYTQVPFGGGQSSISPSPTATTRYRAVVANGSCPSVNSNEFEVSVVSGGIWTGVINSNWNNAGNWCGGVPTASTNVTISSGTLNAPVINTAAAVANNVTVEAGALLRFSGTANVLSITGNLTVNGSFNTSGGTVTYSGTASQNVAGISYDKLRMNGTGAKSLSGSTTVTGNLDLTSGNLQLGNHNLVLESTATVTGGGSASYVLTNGSGVMTKNSLGSTAFTFPAGNGSYTPVTVKNTGVVDHISVSVLPHCYQSYSGFTGSVPMTQKVVDRTFIVQEATVGGSILDIEFQWQAADELPSMDRTRMIVGRYNSTWNFMPGAPQIVTGPPYKISILATPMTGIFAVGDENSPLPVTLLSFTAKLNKESALLNWVTASEVNNSHFDVERSVDGIRFVKIGEVKGKGNTGRRIDYSFTDREAGSLLQSASVLFYRLNQFDFNGRSEYSGISTVSQFKNARFEVLSTAPNPFASSTSISYETTSESRISVTISDAFGRSVETREVSPVTGANTIEIGAGENWAAGVYFVKLTQGDQSRVVRIIKQ